MNTFHKGYRRYLQEFCLHLKRYWPSPGLLKAVLGQSLFFARIKLISDETAIKLCSIGTFHDTSAYLSSQELTQIFQQTPRILGGKYLLTRKSSPNQSASEPQETSQDAQEKSF